MPRYEVFLNPPSVSDLRTPDPQSYTWEIFVAEPSENDSPLPPPATLAAASRRISSIYGNIIWQDDESDEVESQNSQQIRGGM
jgi:hypothetical protein